MQINPDLAHMTPARAKELLAGDIEGYRLPIIELIERQAAEIELLKDAGAWRGLTEQVHALQAEIERLRAMRSQELRYVREVLQNIRKQDGEAARESANDTLAWLENRLTVEAPAEELRP